MLIQVHLADLASQLVLYGRLKHSITMPSGLGVPLAWVNTIREFRLAHMQELADLRIQLGLPALPRPAASRTLPRPFSAAAATAGPSSSTPADPTATQPRTRDRPARGPRRRSSAAYMLNLQDD